MGKITDRIGKFTVCGGLFYLGAITPRMVKRPGRMPGKYYAHRGLHDNMSDAPENSLAAFQKAVEAGYGIELDIQLTKDEQVVVCHDYHLRRLCGVDREIDSLTYEELQQYTIFESGEKIPLFSEVLELVDGQVPLIIELKVKNISSKIAEKADNILQSYAGVYCIESFHPAGLLWYRQNHPDVCRGQLATHDVLKEKEVLNFILRHLLLNFLTAPDFIAYDIRYKEEISKNLCRKIFRCPSIAWTIYNEKELEEAEKYYDYFIFEGFSPKIKN